MYALPPPAPRATNDRGAVAECRGMVVCSPYAHRGGEAGANPLCLFTFLLIDSRLRWLPVMGYRCSIGQAIGL